MQKALSDGSTECKLSAPFACDAAFFGENLGIHWSGVTHIYSLSERPLDVRVAITQANRSQCRLGALPLD